MGYDKGSKANRKTTLEQIEKTTGVTPKQLKAPLFPIELTHIWYDFLDIKNACQTNISFTELDAFCRLTGFELSYYEINVIMHLDAIYRENLGNG